MSVGALQPRPSEYCGDVLSDGLHSYAWDVYNRPTTIDSVSVTYDALGRMVEQDNNGTYTDIIYVPGGAKLLYNPSNGPTLVDAFVPLPGGGTAVYNANGLQYYRRVAHAWRAFDFSGAPSLGV